MAVPCYTAPVFLLSFSWKVWWIYSVIIFKKEDSIELDSALFIWWAQRSILESKSDVFNKMTSGNTTERKADWALNFCINFDTIYCVTFCKQNEFWAKEHFGGKGQLIKGFSQKDTFWSKACLFVAKGKELNKSEMMTKCKIKGLLSLWFACLMAVGTFGVYLRVKSNWTVQLYNLHLPLCVWFSAFGTCLWHTLLLMTWKPHFCLLRCFLWFEKVG